VRAPVIADYDDIADARYRVKRSCRELIRIMIVKRDVRGLFQFLDGYQPVARAPVRLGSGCDSGVHKRELLEFGCVASRKGDDIIHPWKETRLA
jgi:hypothetical protein